ncbi:hypothetical protein [Ekhidna sp.]|uniref:hypothetical protein n=1 Tax=Ekhidna sp. TaxID=2608089 RepID=UPI003299ABB2
MKKVILSISALIICTQLFAQNTFRDSTKYYSFQVNYWFNLHHFLHLEAFINVNEDSTIIARKLPSNAQSKLDVAISYYKENLADQDLRTSDYLTEFKQWITKQEKTLDDIPSQFQSHIEVLQAVSDVYQKEFWPVHEKACKKVLEENIELIRKTEEKFVDRITTLTRQFWQREKLNVDISYVGKVTKWNLRNRPYTSIFPTHVVMNAIGENEIKGNWIELLYHESAHHLILSNSYFIGGTIKDLTETMNVKSPRQLGHSYLFYFTGQLTKQLLAELGVFYESIYMERNGVFSSYYPFLDIHLRDYMDRKITLVEATQRMIKELQ